APRAVAAVAGYRERKGRAKVWTAGRAARPIAALEDLPQDLSADGAGYGPAKRVGDIAVIAEGAVRMVVAGAAEAVAHALDLDATAGQVLGRAAQFGKLRIGLGDLAVGGLELADDGVVGSGGRAARLRIERGDLILGVG